MSGGELHIDRGCLSGTVDIDCVIAVALKILDGKCKMAHAEQKTMLALYDSIRHRQGDIFHGEDIHNDIHQARFRMDSTLSEKIHASRIYAEKNIPKKVMKNFKKKLRQSGTLPDKNDVPLPIA